MPQWHREGHYDFIAERLFSQLKHDRILLEYDDERSGSFAPLRYVPRGKIAVLGLVTTKRANLESLELLRRRLGEATQLAGSSTRAQPAMRLRRPRQPLHPRRGSVAQIRAHPRNLPAGVGVRGGITAAPHCDLFSPGRRQCCTLALSWVRGRGSIITHSSR